MVLSVKDLYCRPKDIDLIPRTHTRSDVVMPTCNPSRGKDRRIPEACSAARPTKLVRPCLKSYHGGAQLINTCLAGMGCRVQILRTR